uniref:RNA helicase n=1 Tax=Heterorhabditis bacteriophora TaxID=37862 RepID=A0A1I7WTP3_HETBA
MSIECEHNIMAMTINNTGTHLIVSSEVRFNDRFKLPCFSSLPLLLFYIISNFSISVESLVVAGGDDNVVRVVGSKDYKNLFIHPLGGHQGSIVNCQFLQDSYDIISVCKRGIANVWTSSLVKGDLVEGQWQKPDDSMETEDDVVRLYYEKTKRYSLLESSGSGKSGINVTSSSFHAKSNILVTAFSNGVFVLHEIPSFSLIHNLRYDGLHSSIFKAGLKKMFVGFDADCFIHVKYGVQIFYLARDMKRYRNFRTLVCPEPTQLGNLAVDKSGDIVVAAGKEVFQVRIFNSSWRIPNKCLIYGRYFLISNIKSFTCMEFSPDGAILLLGGESNNFCLYSVPDRMMMKRFTITQNRSLSGVVLDVNRRNFSEFGNMALIDDSYSDQEPDQKRQIKLPGTKHMDFGERSSRPELDSQTSPATVKRALSLCDFSTALMASLRLDDTALISRTLMTTGLNQNLSKMFNISNTSCPITTGSICRKIIKMDGRWSICMEFESCTFLNGSLIFLFTTNYRYEDEHRVTIWLRSLLNEHGLQLKGRTDVATLTGIQQIVSHHSKLISDLMPVISIPRDNEWKAASFTADFSDSNFGFLGTFEEITPNEFQKPEKKSKTKVIIHIHIHMENNFPRIARLIAEEEKPIQNAWKEFFLPQEIMNAINDMGFTTPTEIQRLVLPSATRDRVDILGAAETVCLLCIITNMESIFLLQGSGKTLAYAIPIVSRLLSEERKGRGPRAIFNILLKYTKFEATQIVGGLAQVKQERILKERCPEITIATPGRLWAMVKEVGTTTSIYVKMNNRLFIKLLSSASEKLQTLVFSATLTYVHREQIRNHQKELTSEMKLKELINLTGLRPQRKVFDLTRKFGTSESLVETRMNCSNLLEKDTSVVYLLERYKGRTLIFTNSIDASRRLYGILKLLKSPTVVLMIHAKMDQKRRLKNLENFTSALIYNLIQFILFASLYFITMFFGTRKEQGVFTTTGLLESLTKKISDKDLPVFPIDSLPLMKCLKNRVKLASELDTLSHRFKKINMSETWFTRTIREAEMEMDGEREHEQDLSNDEMNAIKTQQLQLEAELRWELTVPLPRHDKVQVPVRAKYLIKRNKQFLFISENSLHQSRNICAAQQDSLEENLSEAEALKKKTRLSIKTHQLKEKKFKK